MRSRFLSGDILIAVCALFLGGYLAATADLPSSHELTSRADHLLTAFTPSEVLKVSLRKGTLAVVLRRDTTDPSRFFLGDEGTTLVDPEMVRQLLSSLDFATWSRRLNNRESPELSQLGLDQPQLEAKIQTKRRSFRILIGEKVPHNPDQTYAQVSGTDQEVVFGTVPTVLLEQFMRTEQEFRGRQLFPYSIQNTSQISINAKRGELVLEADRLGFFVKNERLQRADRTATDLIFYQLARASLTQFVPQNEAERIVNADVDALQLFQKGPGPEVMVRIGGTCPDDSMSAVAVRTAPDQLSGCVSKTILPALRLDAKRIFASTASLFTADEIDHVTVTTGSVKLDLIREDADFVLLGDTRRIVPREAGDELMKVLAEASLTQIDEAKLPPLTPYGTLSITGNLREKNLPTQPWRQGHAEGTAAQLTLAIAKGPEGTTFIERQDDHIWLSVPEPLSWAFSADTTWTKERKLSSFDESSILSVTRASSGGPPETIARKDGRYVLVTAGSANSDQTLSRHLFEQLARLEAVRFVSKDEKAPSRPLLTLSFEVEQGALIAHETLTVGKRVRGGHLAWSSLTDAPFVLSSEAVFELQTSVFDRALAQFEPTELSFLELGMEDRMYSFERTGNGLRPVTEGTTDDMLKDIEAALFALQVHACIPATKAAPRKSSLSIRMKKRDDGEPRESQIDFLQPEVWRGQSVYRAAVSNSNYDCLFDARGVLDLMSQL